MTTIARYRYIRIETTAEPEPGRTTRVYFIYNTSTNAIIGKIAWCSYWRQFVFEPSPLTVWSDDCLAAVRDAIQKVIVHHKACLKPA